MQNARIFSAMYPPESLEKTGKTPPKKAREIVKRQSKEIYEFPGGAIYKPPCVQLASNPFFAMHQNFALSSNLIEADHLSS